MTSFSDVDPMTITGPAPLAVGLFGYGGSGKTESALRLAFGMRRVYGGEVFFVDTESRKGLAYREIFPFRYVEFGPPHNALRYCELLESFAHRKGVLVIDQFTEEHDGEGGMLETQEEAKGGKESRNAISWALAKGQHKKLARVLRRVRSTIPIVGTWRAEDKTDWNHKDERTGKLVPVPVGQMPIGSKDIPFEMTATYLLRPGARGLPCLKPETRGEDIMTKIPRWFVDIIREGEVITEEHGEAMARWAWAQDTSKASPEMANLTTAIECAPDVATIETIGREVAQLVKSGALSKADAGKLSAKAKERRAAIATGGGIPDARPSPRPPTAPPPEPGADG